MPVRPSGLRSMLPCVVEGAEPTPNAELLWWGHRCGQDPVANWPHHRLGVDAPWYPAADTYHWGGGTTAVAPGAGYSCGDSRKAMLGPPSGRDDCDVLIDTPGRSQRDKQNISELQNSLRHSPPTRPIQPLARPPPKVLAISRRLVALGPTRCCPTNWMAASLIPCCHWPGCGPSYW